MNKPWKIIKDLSVERSRIGKEGLLEREYRESNFLLFEGIRYALDPFMTFGVKQIPEKKKDSESQYTWDNFKELLKSLASRKLTGNDAKLSIEAAMNLSSKDEWNFWYRLILIKDLKCGVSEKTINKVLQNMKASGKLIVPTFSCQLAEDSGGEGLEELGSRIIQPKLDGVRALCFLNPKGSIWVHSRNGKIIDNFKKIEDQLTMISSTLEEPTVLDGEIVSSNFNNLMTQVRRKTDVNTDDAILNVFDIIPTEDFLSGKYDVSQDVRIEFLKLWYNSISEHTPNIKILESTVIDLSDPVEWLDFSLLNQRYIKEGYEGVMIKDPEAPYLCKRSKAWLKMKPWIEVSLSVVGVEEGDGKYSESLGALICEGQDSGKNIRVNVGSGFTDEMRKDIWKNKNSIIGDIAEIRADVISQNQDGTHSLRFPRFVRWRNIDDGGKI
jgi:DNA ligase 1